jgi:hypothetical protein
MTKKPNDRKPEIDREARDLLADVYRLSREVLFLRRALARGPSREQMREYMAEAPLAELLDDVEVARGDRGAAYFRTRLNGRLEAKRRQRTSGVAGRPRV